MIASPQKHSAQTLKGRVGSVIDPAAVMAIKNLELRAKVVVQGFWHGLHRSPYHGFSVEFSEYRQYTPGDDPRFLDWRVFARSDRYYVKKFEDETNLRCHLLVDNSKSMSYGSLGYTKAEYARTLAATFAYFLYRQGDAVGLLTFDEAIRDFLPARHRTGHLRRLMLALEKPALGETTDLSLPLKRIVAMVTKRGLMLYLSDLLAPVDELERNLVSLIAAGHEVVLVQLLDPAEARFDFDHAALFVDAESGRELHVDPAVARQRYLQNKKVHEQRVQTICQNLGIAYLQILTDGPLEWVLFDFLRERMQRGRKTRRLAGRSQRAGSAESVSKPVHRPRT